MGIMRGLRQKYAGSKGIESNNIQYAQSMFDVPPEPPKPPVLPPPKSPEPAVLFVAPKPVLFVEPKPKSQQEISYKRPVRVEVPSSQLQYIMPIQARVLRV